MNGMMLLNDAVVVTYSAALYQNSPGGTEKHHD
jgi:hypothetical protein